MSGAPTPALGRAPLAAWLILPAVALVLWMFRHTAIDMVGVWTRSETFQHAYLVPPITAWLIWRRRHTLAALPVRPQPIVLLPLAGAALLWLLGDLATVNAASQFALVAMIVLLVPLLAGWPITRALLFPLAFLFFAVPLGEFLVPTLIDHTADFTVAALRLSGIPVFREGNDFVIPSGYWSVVEACSGVRYLIASVMVGTLFAYLNYRSLARRLLFVAIAIGVPIVANWVRAYLIVLIGHLSGNRLAVGVDHLIYGWVFFGIVVGLMFWIGSRWAEPDPPAEPPPDSPPVSLPHRGRLAAVVVGFVTVLAGTQWATQRLEQPRSASTPVLALPSDGALQPFAAVAEDAFPFRPGFRHPNATLAARADHDGAPVWLWVGYYRHQDDTRKLVSSVNTVLADEDKHWALSAQGQARVEVAAGAMPFRTADLRENSALTGAPPKRLRTWRVYLVGDRFIASDARAKVFEAMQQLLGRGDDGAVLMLATPVDADADRRLTAVVQQHSDAWRTWLGRVAAAP